MPKRLSNDEFHKKQERVINLAKQQLNINELSRQTKHSTSTIKYLLKTAKERGIDISSKNQTPINSKRKTLNAINQSINALQINPVRLKQALKLTAKYKTSAQLGDVFSKELNLPYTKSIQLADLLINRQKIKKAIL